MEKWVACKDWSLGLVASTGLAVVAAGHLSNCIIAQFADSPSTPPKTPTHPVMKILLVLAAFVATTHATSCRLSMVDQMISTDSLDQCILSAGSDFTALPPTIETLTEMCRSYGCSMLQSNITRLQKMQGRCDLRDNSNVAVPTFKNVGGRANLGHLGDTFWDFTGTCEDLKQPRCSEAVDDALKQLLTPNVVEASCAQYAGFSFADSTELPSDGAMVKLCNNPDCHHIVGKIKEIGVPACFTLYGDGILDQVMRSYDTKCRILDDSIPIPPTK